MTMPNAIHSLALMTHPSPPHAAVNPTASDLLSLCELRSWRRIYDKDPVTARRLCSARTRGGIVHLGFLPHGMPLSFE